MAKRNKTQETTLTRLPKCTTGIEGLDEITEGGLPRGRPTLICGSASPTEQKRSEGASEQLAAIVQSSEDAIIGKTLEGIILSWNSGAEKTYGYSPEEVIGRHISILLPPDHPDEVSQILERIGQGESIKGNETVRMRKDGQLIHISMTASPVRDTTGKIVSASIIARDITEHKRTEGALQEYQKVIENSQDMIAVVDQQYKYLLANARFLEMRGMDREQVVGRPVSEVLGKEVFERIVKRNLDACFQGKVVNYEMKNAYPGLGERDLTVSYFPIQDRDGINRVASVIRDITERKRAEERYRTILRTTIDGFWIVDMEGHFLDVNDAYCRLIGYDRDELLTMRIPDVEAVESPEETTHRIQKIMEGGGDRFETRHRCKDGSTIDVEVSVNYMEDGGRQMFVFLRDITERKRAEEILRQSEEKYRSILENIQDGYIEVDLAGNFTFVNDVVCKRLGYSREELIGMNNRQYTDETTAKKTYQLYNRIYRTGEPVRNYEEEVIRKDGTRWIYELSVSLIRNPEGEPVGFRGISRDITERKRAEEALRLSEERYRTILESIEDGYYEVDLAGNFTFVNDSICRIWGYPEEELMGMNDRQYIHKETAKRIYQVFNHVFKTGESGRCNHEVLRKDGTKKYVEVSISLKKDALGKPIGFRGITRDITDRKRIEEQLFQAEKLRAVGEMASGVAHDFNNALAAILGNTQLLLYTAQDEALKETLKIIEKVAKDSSQTVRRLQDFTRKPVPQELFKVDINAIVKDSIEITKPKWKDEAQSKGIPIEMVSNLEDIPLASGNASELREVFTNIIFNAIEAMHEGGKIEIRTFKKRRDIFIQISDTGVGIVEEAKKRIFEPFFTTKPFTNTGLGLSMSYGIVKRFGGEIEVESKVGQGTTFTIILPIGEDEKEEAADSQPIKKGRRARILVIDDDEFVRSVLSRTLAQADHQVTLAEDGGKGVQLFKEGEFDVVLTDLGMPGVSGWEVCRMIKEISPHTPVGMITGWGDERNRSKMEECGLDFFISKPFDLAQILNVVAETMESKEE
jgi:PAS domain S-box-containing protein